MHTPYKNYIKRKADFRVSYKFRDKEDGGRKTLPYQGIRSDFSYDKNNQVYMVFPEFEDESGNIILDDKTSVPKKGTAQMWIVNPGFRAFHQEQIKVGTKCFFREGPMVTADCEVLEILGLITNPSSE